MLNEWQEFLDYTGTVTYTASGKNDMTYLGRFTFDTLLNFEGLARVLAVLARGHLFHGAGGATLQEKPRSRIDYTRRALCAWCMVPAWRNKVLQFQAAIFSPQTKGAWILRFDDVIADALELGPLRKAGPELSPALLERLRAVAPEGVPFELDWVVLPVANFDAYFGRTSFSKKYLRVIPETIIVRDGMGFGVCRYRIAESIVKEYFQD